MKEVDLTVLEAEAYMGKDKTAKKGKVKKGDKFAESDSDDGISSGDEDSSDEEKRRKDKIRKPKINDRMRNLASPA